MKVYQITYWAHGLRVKVHGQFEIAALNQEDAIRAALNRWPDMNITECVEKTK